MHFFQHVTEYIRLIYTYVINNKLTTLGALLLLISFGYTTRCTNVVKLKGKDIRLFYHGYDADEGLLIFCNDIGDETRINPSGVVMPKRGKYDDCESNIVSMLESYIMHNIATANTIALQSKITTENNINYATISVDGEDLSKALLKAELVMLKSVYNNKDSWCKLRE